MSEVPEICATIALLADSKKCSKSWTVACSRRYITTFPLRLYILEYFFSTAASFMEAGRLVVGALGSDSSNELKERLPECVPYKFVFWFRTVSSLEGVNWMSFFNSGSIAAVQ